MSARKSNNPSPVVPPKSATGGENSRATSRSPKSQRSAKSPGSKRSQSPPKSRSKAQSLTNENSDLGNEQVNSGELVDENNDDIRNVESSENVIEAVEEDQQPKEDPLVL
jgi:hypothetical protein